MSTAQASPPNNKRSYTRVTTQLRELTEQLLIEELSLNSIKRLTNLSISSIKPIKRQINR